jgi:imidazolonepropionase-like amidohydrolase
MIDGISSAPTADAAIVVDNDRISYAGPADGVTWNPDCRVIDVPEATALPGLIDVHVHVTNSGHLLQKLDRGKVPSSFAQTALTGYANALKSLLAGFTTLRDVGAPGYTDIAVRDMINSGRLEGSRLYVAGQGLCITGGHMDAATYPEHFSVSGRIGVCDSPDAFRQAVRHNVKMGVDLIKINANIRFLRDGDIVFREEMSIDEMKATCDEAHKFDCHVAAHTAGGPPTEQAILAGVDTIEHGRWLTDRCIELMCEHGTFWVPTFLTSARNTGSGPDAVAATEHDWEHLLRAHEATFKSFERAHAAGVKIAAGTDCGFICDHGENAGELTLMVEAGFTPMEAIQTATRTNARLLRLEADIGSLTPGTLADIVLVDRDPLDDIAILEDTGRILYVIKEGRIVRKPDDPMPA